MSDARRAMLLMAVFGAVWACVELLGGLLSKPYSPYQVVWSRYAVHLAFMVAVWGWREPRSLWRTGRPGYQVARSLLMLVMPAAYIMSLERRIDPGVISSIVWTSPLWMLALARLVLGEVAPAPVWIAALVSGAGAMIALPPGAWPRTRLLVLPAAVAISFSLYVVMTRSLRTESTRANLFYTALGVFASLSFVMPWLWITPNLHDLLVLAAIGLVGYAGLLAIDRMTSLAPVAATAPLAPLQLVFLFGMMGGLGLQHAGTRAALGLLVVCATAAYLWFRTPRFAAAPGT